MNKIAIIGCGNVGMAYAYSIILNNVNVDEIVLIDIDKNKAEGEAMDLSHCAVFRQNKCKIVAGDYLDCIDAQIVMISAGRNQRLGETRTDLIHSNIVIFKDIISKLKDVDFNGIYLIATNPLDVMTYFTLKISNTKPNKVIGSGTTLDTARLKNILSARHRQDTVPSWMILTRRMEKQSVLLIKYIPGHRNIIQIWMVSPCSPESIVSI